MDSKRHITAQSDGKNGTVTEQRKKKVYPKSHIEHWRNRVVKRGETHYSVRLEHKGQREWFNLETSNKLEAADLSKTIYGFMRANGMEATLAKYKPAADVAPDVETIGDLIQAASDRSEVKLKTLTNYRNNLRRLAADIKRIPDDPSKYRPGGSDWQVKVDKIKLKDITADRVLAWRKKQFVGLSPAEKKTKEISVATVLNHSRSIWKHCDYPTPFADVKWKHTTKRFVPTIRANHLLHFAEEELEEKKLEQFKCLTLCLFLGMRRAEVDCLTWDQIDFDGGRLNVEATDYFSPKSDDSTRSIPIPPSLLKKISKWREGNESVFVLAGGEARPDAKYSYYRAEDTWSELTAWLKSKGVTAKKPIHYLRGLAGGLMYSKGDIYAAQRFLGHADIRTTIGSYVHEELEAIDLVSEKPEPKLVSEG